MSPKSIIKEIRTYSSNDALVKEKRNHIAKCAVRVFLKKGFHGTSIRDLAEECSMTQGALYNYFGSKEDILHLIAARRVDPDLNDFFSKLGNVNRTQALRKCMKYYFDVCNEVAASAICFNREINYFSHEDRQAILQEQVNIQRFFEQLIREGLKSGEFKTDSPELVAFNILIVGFDWGSRQWFLRKLFTLHEYTEKQTQFVLDAISTNKTGT